MSESNKSEWAGLANLFLSSSDDLRVFSSRELPEQDSKSSYTVDLAMAISGLLNFENFHLKGHSRFRENRRWNSLRPPLSLSMSIAQLTLLSENGAILSPKNAEYLARKLDNVFPELGSLIITTGEVQIPDSYSPSWVLARSVRLMDQLISKCGMSYKQGDELERMTVLVGEFADVLQRLKYVSSQSHSSSSPGDLLAPLRITSHRFDTEEKIHNDADRSVSKSADYETLDSSNPLISDSERHTYDSWVEHCRRIGNLQRMPERLYMDLIPPIEVADHLTKSILAWEDFLERQIPGRRQWLLEEGVTEKDFDKYWSQPAWVLEFIDKLMSRNLQLEYQSHMEMGESEVNARLMALAFIPRFSTVPPEDNSLPFRGLPFELFERVRHHLASVDNEEFQSEMIANDCFFVNDYIRRRIKKGLL